MNSKESKFRTDRNPPLKTPVLSSQKYSKNSNPAGKNLSRINNTALYAVSRNQSMKRLNMLIGKSKSSLESLQDSEAKLNQFNHHLSTVSQSTCSVIGNEFFNKLSQSLAQVFEVNYVIIGKTTGTNGEKVKTLAFWDGSNIAENFTYDLKGTPCEKVVNRGICYFPNVQESFSNDLFLVEHNILSYLGVPIFNIKNQLIGLIAVMGETLIPRYEHYWSILNIFAPRCASELERMHAETQLESKAQELKKSNQVLKDFIALASHDLRSPACKIAQFGQRLSEKVDCLEPESKDYLLRMQNSALRMQELINDLQVFSQTSIKTELTNKINLEKVFKEIIADLGLSPLMNDGRILVDTLPTIEGDLYQVRLLFQNLLSNAIKFHSPDRLQKINVYSRPCGQNNWGISVKDQGIGFDEKFKGRIFLPFERLHSKSEYKGTGMGLAICQKIAENHGGNILAQSKPGHGACFTVVLPASHSEN